MYRYIYSRMAYILIRLIKCFAFLIFFFKNLGKPSARNLTVWLMFNCFIWRDSVIIQITFDFGTWGVTIKWVTIVKMLYSPFSVWVEFFHQKQTRDIGMNPLPQSVIYCSAQNIHWFQTVIWDSFTRDLHKGFYDGAAPCLNIFGEISDSLLEFNDVVNNQSICHSCQPSLICRSLPHFGPISLEGDINLPVTNFSHKASLFTEMIHNVCI